MKDIDKRKDHLKISKDIGSNIILLPEYKESKEEVEKLRVELSMLLLEKDELIYVICKNIETFYMLNLGHLEYTAYELECESLRLKRKIELIQRKINRQEKIDLQNIEKTLDKEFENYKKKLDQYTKKINDALQRSRNEIMSKEETQEFKKMYRSIVKALHPDLNQNLTPAQMQLFDNAVTAYKDGDFLALQIIYQIVGDKNTPEENKDSLKKLSEEKERLKKLIDYIVSEIKEIKSDFPYIFKEIVENPEKLEERKNELEIIINYYEELIETYRKRIDEMLR